MKRKQLIAVGILSICLFASGCGSNTTGTEQGAEDTVIVQETEMQETETQEAETQETEVQETETQEVETQETADNVISDEKKKVILQLIVNVYLCHVMGETALQMHHIRLVIR